MSGSCRSRSKKSRRGWPWQKSTKIKAAAYRRSCRRVALGSRSALPTVGAPATASPPSTCSCRTSSTKGTSSIKMRSSTRRRSNKKGRSSTKGTSNAKISRLPNSRKYDCGAYLCCFVLKFSATLLRRRQLFKITNLPGLSSRAGSSDSKTAASRRRFALNLHFFDFIIKPVSQLG